MSTWYFAHVRQWPNACPTNARRSMKVALAVLLVVTGFSCTPPQETVHLENPRVRALIANQDKTVGYFDIINSGTTAVTLVAAESPHARLIEIHTSVQEGDAVHMRRLEQLTIAPGTTVYFRSGGTHLMLFGVEHLPEETRVELITAEGKRLVGQFKQVPLGAQG